MPVDSFVRPKAIFGHALPTQLLYIAATDDYFENKKGFNLCGKYAMGKLFYSSKYHKQFLYT